MTSKEFTIWLKGFTTGVHEFNITPKQWDLLKEKLAEVKDEERIGTPIGEGGWGTPNTTPNWQWPHYPNPLDNPYKITCSSGSFGTTNPNYAITTTPGYSSITIANPNLVSFGTSSLTTSNTATYPPPGSTISYTTYQPFSTQDANSLKPTKQTKFKKRKAKSVKEWEDNFDLGGEE